MRTAPGIGAVAYQEIPGEISLDPVVILTYKDLFGSEEAAAKREEGLAMAAA